MLVPAAAAGPEVEAGPCVAAGVEPGAARGLDTDFGREVPVVGVARGPVVTVAPDEGVCTETVSAGVDTVGVVTAGTDTPRPTSALVLTPRVARISLVLSPSLSPRSH